MTWKPGDDPAGLWHPALGHLFGLRPCDMQDMTPAQMSDIKRYVEKLTDG